METSREQPVDLNLKAASAMASHQEAILDSLLKLQRSNPHNEVLQEVEKLGGIGAFADSIDIVTETAQNSADVVDPQNAEFVVAYLNSGPIQNFIVGESEGEITLNEVSEVRDFFLGYI